MNDVKEKQQTISFCGVIPHHQNGITEEHIQDLSNGARKMLLHASSRWPSAILVALWPYALRQAQDVTDCVPFNESGQFPIKFFTSTNVAPDLGDFHTFGCSIFALDSCLQANNFVPRWDSCARLGINLDRSPHHA